MKPAVVRKALSKAPSIPIDRPISWEDWMAGRKARREISERLALQGSQRPRSSADRHLRRKFNGKRGLPFAKTESLSER